MRCHRRCHYRRDNPCWRRPSNDASKAGQTWLLRLIVERAGIQTIVLDNEGEFASLREAVDVLLVGASGELLANPRHAALLARRLIEYKVSAVVDLYELKLAERRCFVKLFLESLIQLPRDLWRPTLVILDEAHMYCPERGSGESESTEAVISLMSQGRKRGYAGVMATQRLSKLHKDAAAEANNVIIGRTWLDADQAAKTGYKANGGGFNFNNALGRLTTLELVQ